MRFAAFFVYHNFIDFYQFVYPTKYPFNFYINDLFARYSLYSFIIFYIFYYFSYNMVNYYFKSFIINKSLYFPYYNNDFISSFFYSIFYSYFSYYFSILFS